jgi:hypothetical protein
MATINPENEPNSPQKRKRIVKRERLFELPDARFLQRNHVLHQHFTNRLSAFVGFDPVFAPPFALNWKNAIEAAEVFPDDETTLDELQQLTDNLTTQRQQLVALLRDYEYYARKAFAATPAVLHEFQFEKIAALQQKPAALILAALVLVTIAETDYPTELTAAGLPPTLLSSIQLATKAVAGAEVQQEKFKRTRIKRTRLRIAALNAIYKTAQQVIAAANVIYRTDAENRSLFVWEV